MKILLTGGCGYIGTNLTNKLLDEGHNMYYSGHHVVW